MKIIEVLQKKMPLHFCTPPLRPVLVVGRGRSAGDTSPVTPAGGRVGRGGAILDYTRQIFVLNRRDLKKKEKNTRPGISVVYSPLTSHSCGDDRQGIPVLQPRRGEVRQGRAIHCHTRQVFGGHFAASLRADHGDTLFIVYSAKNRGGGGEGVATIERKHADDPSPIQHAVYMLTQHGTDEADDQPQVLLRLVASDGRDDRHERQDTALRRGTNGEPNRR